VLPRIHPMRLRIAKPFNDPDCIFELKHDGFRALAYIEEGKCRLDGLPLGAVANFRAASIDAQIAMTADFRGSSTAER
jgi:hypothetical protein